MNEKVKYWIELSDYDYETAVVNIEARYPSHKEQLMLSLTNDRSELILKQTKGLRTWIKERL